MEKFFSFFSYGLNFNNFDYSTYLFYLINIILVGLILFFIHLAIKGVGLLDYLHFRKLPKNFKIYSEAKGRSYYDKLKNFSGQRLIYKNKIKPNFAEYMAYYDDIKQFLNIDFLRIKRYGRKGVLLEIKDILKTFEINNNNYKDYYKKNYIYFGKNDKNENIYKEINEMKHLLIVGQSGAGKSVLVNNLINSLLFNNIKMYLIDLKGGVEFFKYEKQSAKVVDNLEDLGKLLDNLIKIMNNRLKKMKEKGETFSSEAPIFVIFDEIQSINDNKEKLGKKLYDKYWGQIQELLAKARATNIKIWILTQKPDNINTNIRNNIQLKIIMKLNNNTALQTALGGAYKEIIEEIGIYPKYFTPGKFLFENETEKGVKYEYIQSPYISENINFLENENKKNKINLKK